jgi:tetratricopeptide (TPR) repeat protein
MRSRPSAEAIEEVLEEAEFFAAQGLYSDAEAILADMLESAPDHVLLKEQLAEVRSAMADAPEEEPSERDSLAPEDHSFDIAASLDALDDLDEPDTSPAMASPDQEVDVDQVFAKFKEGVKAVVDDSDAATHYDLGLAYKEMGLHKDAIAEFEISSKDPTRECMCFFMIGLTYKELADTQNAKEAFLKGLAASWKNPSAFRPSWS